MNEKILDEIPYIVTPRKDTGLTNSKIGIWLFLASEVMLFGGLFSGYIFLRVYADYPWPERVLPIVPGLLNTFILILSSVTVVFAWAMLKLRKWNMFLLFMGTTIACAAIFMAFKVVEYKAKFSHQGVRLEDYTILEGHVHKGAVDSQGHIYHLDDNGNPAKHHADENHSKSEKGGAEGKMVYQKTSIDQIVFDTKDISFDLKMFNDGYVNDLLTQAESLRAQITFDKDIKYTTSPDSLPIVVAKAGEPVTLKALKEAKALWKKTIANNGAVRTEELRRQWRVAKHDNPDAPNWQNAQNIKMDMDAIRPNLVASKSVVTAKVEPHVAFLLDPKTTNASAKSAKRKDSTLMSGNLIDSSMELGIDGVDFTFLVQRAEEKGIDPESAIEKSWILKNNPQVRAYWEKHKEYIAELDKKLLDDADGDIIKAEKAHHLERYKMTWKEMVRYGSEGETDLQWFNGFAGPNHKKEEWAKHFPDVSLPREQIAFESKFTPRWNNYYAIYFTITGLHGLHIIGGAIVLGYYMFCPNMFRKNPDWLANRVEVAGLFWHFVDLVWIFLFPILYLM